MLIPIWLFVIMITLIVILSVSIYYLIGFFTWAMCEICVDENNYLRDRCWEIIDDPSTTSLEKKVFNKLSDIINMIEEEEKVFKILSSWPITLIAIRWSSSIVEKKSINTTQPLN